MYNFAEGRMWHCGATGRGRLGVLIAVVHPYHVITGTCD